MILLHVTSGLGQSDKKKNLKNRKSLFQNCTILKNVSYFYIRQNWIYFEHSKTKFFQFLFLLVDHDFFIRL